MISMNGRVGQDPRYGYGTPVSYHIFTIYWKVAVMFGWIVEADDRALRPNHALLHCTHAYMNQIIS
jgi:hypothetical protein